MKALTVDMISNAIAHDKSAVAAIMQIYDRYINALARVKESDEHGNPKERIDPDIKSQLQSKLLAAIPKFRIERNSTPCCVQP